MINEFILALPLLLIAIGSILVLMLDAATRNKQIVYYTSILVLLGLGISAGYTLQFDVAIIAQADKTISANTIFYGGMSAVFDIIFAMGGLLTLFASREYLQRNYKEINECYSLVLLAVVGMVVIAHSNSLIMLFLGVELMSIVFYILTGFFRNREHALEAALKYFILGSFASGFLLYGIALIYGSTGSLILSDISQQIASGNYNSIYLSIGLGLMTVGLCFKVAAFPFHQWAPDVYYGSPTAISGFLCTSGKAAALVALVVVAKNVLSVETSNVNYLLESTTARNILAGISACTMIIGNLSALAQKNVKRMLAYSSVAHAGYILMGIVACSTEGFYAVAFYCAVYLFMQVGAFAIVGFIEFRDEGNMLISDYADLRTTHPALAAAMACFMLSLAGIPPFGGFFGKYFLFVAAIKSGYLWLTLIAVVASIISMYFYIGLILTMYFKNNENPINAGKMQGTKLTVALSIIGVILLGIMPNVFYGLFNFTF